MKQIIALCLVAGCALGSGVSASEFETAPADPQQRQATQSERRTIVRSPVMRTIPQRADGLQPFPDDLIEPSATQREAIERADRRPTAPTMRKRSGQLPPLDDFPYSANDFSDNEKIYVGKAVHNPDKPNSTWQQFAYDIGAAVQLSNGTWRDTKQTINWKSPKNSDYFIYGKPVYAVSEGVIVNCWRNAPENPRPASSELDTFEKDMALEDQTWLHADTRAGKVHGSGNFVMVREDNGNHVHYAHGQPGSIPSKLCPHDGVHLNPGSWKKDSAVPADKQVRIRKGEFVFRTGNSGTSSAPHLHLDRTEPDMAVSVKLLFRNGLANPLNMPVHHGNAKTTKAEWESFAGQQIPPGPVLVWPPRPQGGQYAWHGMDASKWGQYFRHMSDSGYQATWVDGYSVAGKPHFNTIWRPATAPWLAYALLTGTDYQKRYNEATADGFALVHVDSVLSGGQPRYNAIFVKGASMNFVARHGQNAADFDSTFKDLTKKGYSTVNASVVSVNGNRYYTSLFRKQDLGGWVLLPGIPKASYQKVYEENVAAGRRPNYVNAYRHGNGVYYSVVFSQKPAGQRKDRHGMTPAAYQNEFNSAGALPLIAISGVDGATSNHEYIATWRRD